MYSRPPNYPRQKISIPDNYSGNAFKNRDVTQERDIPRSSFGDMPPPKHFDPPHSDPEPHLLEDEPSIEQSPIPLHEETDETTSAVSADEPAPTQAKSSPFSSILPSFISSSSHFPFGHGIGSEELLILAMMMLIYLSEGDTDNEFLLILGLLLFAG